MTQAPPPFQHLLVCVDVHNEDGCKLAHPLIDRAWGLAAAWGARVTVLSVVPPVSTPASLPLGTESPALRGLIETASAQNDAARRTVNTLVDRLRAHGVEVAGRLFERDGDVADNIVETVHTVAADAILLSSHSRHGLARRVLGSVAERTASRSPVPVIIIPHVALGV